MSQAKVDKYKHEKANRKAILKREKRKQIAGRIIGLAICAAFVGWIGYSAYDSIEAKAAATLTEVDVSALEDYLNGLTETEADMDESTDQDTTGVEDDDADESTDQDTTGVEDDDADEGDAGEDNTDNGDAEA